ncbi:MAG: deoxyguanosinetriphosphate triphosphohydrolase, partial [Oscillospiraceae bacterium]
VDHIEKDGEGLNLTFEVKNGIACHSDNCPDAITLEGKVVRIADKIAYINHDIEDAIRGKILRESDLPYDCIYVLGRGKSARISTIIKSIIENSDTNICMSKDVSDAHNRLKEFMFENVYTNSSAKSEEGKAEEIIIHLYRHFLKNINKLPDLYIKIADDFGDERAVCDYISGMTDIYAIDLYKEIFLPKFW